MHLTRVDWTWSAWATLLFAVAGGVALFCGHSGAAGDARVLDGGESRGREHADVRRCGGGAVSARHLRAVVPHFLTFVVPLAACRTTRWPPCSGVLTRPVWRSWLRFTPALGFVFLAWLRGCGGSACVGTRRQVASAAAARLLACIMRAGLVECIAALGAGTRLRRLALTRLEPAGTELHVRESGSAPLSRGYARRPLRRAPAPHGKPRSGAGRSSPPTHRDRSARAQRRALASSKQRVHAWARRRRR